MTLDKFLQRKAIHPPDGPELKREILKFVNAVSGFWPDWPVSYVDLHDNSIGTEESARVWLNRLREEGLIEATKGFKRHSRARGKPDTKAYRIAAGAADKVKSELSSAEAEAGFPDNQFYHLIDLEVEASGPFAFVIMPFREEEFPQDVYKRVIRSIVRDNLICECVRNDQDLWPGQLDDKFYSHIRKSDFLIAELTTENPNVVYELGLAHAYNKEVIVLVNESTRTEKLSFDYDKFSTVFYSDEDELRSKLEPMIRSLGNKLGLLRE